VNDLPPPAISNWVSAVLQRVEARTPRIDSFFFSAELPPYRAGQHVDVRLTAPDGYQAQRSYSIASAPGAALLELAIERLDDGEVSSFFHDIAAAGDSIELRGPVGGHFVWGPADGGPLLLLGGGSGVVPLVAMLRSRAAQATPRVPALLVCSARTLADLAFREELLAMEAGDPELRVVLVSTREAPVRAQDGSRRLDAAFLQQVLAGWGHDARHVFVCGSNRFVEAAAGALLQAGVPAAKIRTERYG
jgi:ferredoxin-NADP reductase